MPTRFDQAVRSLSVATPFGKELVLQSIGGKEELSRPFEYRLEMLSENDDLDPADIIGHPVAVRLDQGVDQTRYFHGMVREFRHGGRGDQATTYWAMIVPDLWKLSQTTDCRIFQEMTTPQIVEEVLGEFGIDYELKLDGDYSPWEYCVQYRESDLAFVSRLLEEEGAYYYFRHKEDGHQLTLADGVRGYYKLDDYQVEYAGPNNTADNLDQIKHWERASRFASSAVAQTDYNFKTPSSDLKVDSPSRKKRKGAEGLEVYDYHSRHPDTARGTKLANVRMEAIEASQDEATGESTYRSFSPGGLFEFGYHRSERERGKAYVLKKVETFATIRDAYVAGVDEAGEEFSNRFVALPAETVARPQRVTPQPIVEGPQTAVVVGPKGEEIHTDEFGRVKCQFHWDRRGRFDEKSSCWVRVSQQHAGGGWGGIDLPRIGEEVIIDFLEGDPDAPIITGRVYNADNMPPFALPGGMTRSGMKSNTHKGSGNNEISMDDTAGQEQLRTHAQYDMDTSVGNNQTLVVGVDRTESIGNNDSLIVGANRSESVGANKTETVGNNKNTSVGKKLVFNAGSSITLKCGASKIYMNAGGVINITGTIITTAAAANAAVAAPLTQVVGAAMLTTVGAVNMTTGGAVQVYGGLASVTGSEKCDIASSGTTKIEGGTITLN